MKSDDFTDFIAFDVTMYPDVIKPSKTVIGYRKYHNVHDILDKHIKASGVYLSKADSTIQHYRVGWSEKVDQVLIESEVDFELLKDEYRSQTEDIMTFFKSVKTVSELGNYMQSENFDMNHTFSPPAVIKMMIIKALSRSNDYEEYRDMITKYYFDAEREKGNDTTYKGIRKYLASLCEELNTLYK